MVLSGSAQLQREDEVGSTAVSRWTPKRQVLVLRTVVWVLCLLPLARLAWRAGVGEGLGANPIEALQLWAGRSSLVLLLGALAVTPIRRITGWNKVQKVRRLVGLFAFFYVCLHLTIYVALDQFFGWSYIVEDVVERPYILLGTAAFLLLLPLAITSTRGWIRRLGRRWRTLHRLVYPAAVLAVLHFLLVTKADNRDPFIAGGVLALLLILRLPLPAFLRREG